MAVTTPVAFAATCPRCKIRRFFVGQGSGVLFRCGGCEWYFTLGTQSPAGSTNASRSAGATTLPVASGGASFTTGMLILVETGASAEVVTCTSTGSATSIPVTALAKAHNSASAIGQLLISATYSGVGVGDAVPASPGWGF